MESKATLLDPSKFIGEISRTESYREQRSRKLGQGSIRLAVMDGAREMSEFHTKPETKYRDPEGDVHNVIAQISNFADGVEALQHLETEGADRNEMIPHLQKVIEFNHAIKSLIDSVPTLEFDEVVQFVTQMYASIHKEDWQTIDERRNRLGWFHVQTKHRLSGMRHEIAAEQIIGMIDDVEIIYNDDATIEDIIEDDLNGIDIRVKARGKLLGLDIKVSKTGVEKKRAKNSSTGHLAIWSQLRDQDFIKNGKNGFRISPERAAEKAGGMRTAIMNARHEEELKQRRLA